MSALRRWALAALLLAAPAAAPGQPPAFAALAFLDRAHLCVVMEAQAPGLYRARHFDREGHRLPVLDAPGGAFQPVPLPPNLYRIVARPPVR